MTSIRSTVLIPYDPIYATATPDGRSDSEIPEQDDSDSSTETISTSTVSVEKSYRELRRENKRLRRTQAEQAASIAKAAGQQKQKEQEHRKTRNMQSFARKQTFLVSLGDAVNLADNIRKANQQARDHLSYSKRRSDRTGTSRHRASAARRTARNAGQPSDGHNTSAEDASSATESTRERQGADSTGDCAPSKDRESNLIDLTEILERQTTPVQADEEDFGISTPPATAAIATEASKTCKSSIPDEASQSDLPVYLLQETATIDLGERFDLSTQEAQHRARENFRPLDDSINVHSSLRNALTKDFEKLRTIYPSDMKRLFPGKVSAKIPRTAVTIKCLRGYLRQRSPQADQFQGPYRACRACSEQHYFCYSTIKIKSVENEQGLLAIVLPLDNDSRSSEITPDREEFYRIERDLLVRDDL